MTTNTIEYNPEMDEVWDCKLEGYHLDAVSMCCGGYQHEYIEGMCAKCNEYTGWVCELCDADVSNIVYGEESGT